MDFGLGKLTDFLTKGLFVDLMIRILAMAAFLG